MSFALLFKCLPDDNFETNKSRNISHMGKFGRKMTLHVYLPLRTLCLKFRSEILKKRGKFGGRMTLYLPLRTLCLKFRSEIPQKRGRLFTIK